jgi:hypothetical protein
MCLVVELVVLLSGDFIEPYSLLDEFICVVFDDEPLVELDLPHPHLAVSNQGAVCLVDQSDLEKGLVVRIVKQMLRRVLERLLVVFLDLPLIKAHHVGRNQSVFLEEISEAFALHLLRIEAFSVDILGIGRISDQPPSEFVGNDY